MMISFLKEKEIMHKGIMTLFFLISMNILSCVYLKNLLKKRMQKYFLRNRLLVLGNYLITLFCLGKTMQKNLNILDYNGFSKGGIFKLGFR